MPERTKSRTEPGDTVILAWLQKLLEGRQRGDVVVVEERKERGTHPDDAMSGDDAVVADSV